MKNWSTTKKIVVVILVLLLIAALLYQFTSVFGNEKGFFGDRGKKTECIGGYLTYAGVASNIPCSVDRIAAERGRKTDCIGGYVTYAGVQSNIPCNAA